MVELSVVRDIVAIFGVIAGFTYYVLTVRNTSKVSQKEQMNLRMQYHDLTYMDTWSYARAVISPQANSLSSFHTFQVKPMIHGFTSTITGALGELYDL